MGFFSNLFGGGNSTLELPRPYKAAPGNIGDAVKEYNRLFECFKRIIEDGRWFDNDYLDPFVNAYQYVAQNYNKTRRFGSLCRGGDTGIAIYDGSKPLFAAFSPFYDSNDRFYRPFGLISSSYLIELESTIYTPINPDDMKFLIYYNPDGESVLVDYVNLRWIDGRNSKVYNIC